MDIKKRINARKVVLAYYYQHCFFLSLEKSLTQKLPMESAVVESGSLMSNNSGFLDPDFLREFQDKQSEWAQDQEIFLSKITAYQKIESDELVQYYLDHFFDQWDPETIDLEYVMQMFKALPNIFDELVALVNQYSHSFGFEKMDFLDQALLLLAYGEHKNLDTPRSVIINEAVEIAKRYADPGAPKLLNGLLEKILISE